MPLRRFSFSLVPGRIRVATALLLAAVALAGCSDIDSEGDLPNSVQRTLTITPSLGLVRHADIIVRDASDAVIARGTTGNSGQAVIRVPGTGPWVVSVAGNATAEYFDENLGAFAPFPTGEEIRALVPSGTTAFTVSGLTELAHALWKSEPGLPLNASNILSANHTIRRTFANSSLMTNILDVPVVPAATPGNGSLEGNAAGLHAVVLAALTDIGQGQPAPALAAISRLRDDLADGDIDNANAAGPLPGTALYLPATFANDFAALLNVRRGQWGDNALQAAVIDLLPLTPPTWLGPGVVGTVQPAVLSAGLYKNSIMQFAKTPGLGTDVATLLEDGSTYPVSIRHGGVLTVGSTSYRFPYHRIVNGSLNNNEIVWAAGDGYEFALGDNALGLFNSLKLYATDTAAGGRGALLGQLDIGGDWAPHASIMTGGINAITWANDLFVAVGSGKKIITSSDGINWSASEPPVTTGEWSTVNAVIHDGTQFVIVGDTANAMLMPPLIATSTDGVTWTAQTWSPLAPLTALVDVTAAGGRITAIGTNGAVVSSVNGGLTWSTETQNTQNFGAGIASNGTARVMVGSGQLVGFAGFHQILLHDGSDGARWRSVVSETGYALNSVVYTGSQFIAIGYRQVSGGGANPPSNTIVLTSPDGETWTTRTYAHDEIPVSFWMRKLFHDGTRTYAVGDRAGQQLILSSADGVNWVEEFLGNVTGQTRLSGITASPTRTIAVGPTRVLMRD